MISKKQRFYLILVFVAVLCAGGVAVYLHNRPDTRVVANIGKIYQQVRERIRIRGFKFTGYNEKGLKVLTIRADKFSVEKKKIGFITTSLLNVAIVKNARIDMYARGGVSGENAAATLKDQLSGVTFEDSFSKETLASLPVKNVSSILIQPVSLNLYNGDSLVTGISADSADLAIKQKAIVFKGGVKVVSGDRTLTTERLVFSPEKAILKTDTKYILNAKGRTSEGTGFSSDIFLAPEAEPKESESADKTD